MIAPAVWAGELSLPLDDLRHVGALDVFHDDVAQVVRLARVEHADDAGMTEPGHRPGLGPEPCREVQARVVDQRGGQHFDRHRAIERKLTGLEERAHAALPDQCQKLEVRQQCLQMLQRRGLPAARRRFPGAIGQVWS
jgi:hypothetical protein